MRQLALCRKGWKTIGCSTNNVHVKKSERFGKGKTVLLLLYQSLHDRLGNTITTVVYSACRSISNEELF